MAPSDSWSVTRTSFSNSITITIIISIKIEEFTDDGFSIAIESIFVFSIGEESVSLFSEFFVREVSRGVHVFTHDCWFGSSVVCPVYSVLARLYRLGLPWSRLLCSACLSDNLFSFDVSQYNKLLPAVTLYKDYVFLLRQKPFTFLLFLLILIL